MPTRSDLLPAQLRGAEWLSRRDAAILADDPGYGKTAQAVLACDDRFAVNVLVVTTASARTNWLVEFGKWSAWGRKGQAVFTTATQIDPAAQVVVVAWSLVKQPAILTQLLGRKWDALILDESHYAKALQTGNTTAVFGGFNEDGTRRADHALVDVAEATWCLTGTPVPNSPADLFPVLKALFPGTLAHVEGRYDRFEARYCKTRMMKGRPVKVIYGGKNEEELGAIIRPNMLRRLATDLPPLTIELFHIDDPDAARQLAALEDKIDAEALAAAMAQGREILDKDFPGLAELRRLHGVIKARAAVKLITDELKERQGWKVVLFRWHKEVGSVLRDGLNAAKIGHITIDGSTPGGRREELVRAFQTNPAVRVADCQLVAASEAITLTAAHDVIYVESSLVPKDMEQSVRRVLRRGQKHPCHARLLTLPGSVDPKIQGVVERKLKTIRLILE